MGAVGNPRYDVTHSAPRHPFLESVYERIDPGRAWASEGRIDYRRVNPSGMGVKFGVSGVRGFRIGLEVLYRGGSVWMKRGTVYGCPGSSSRRMRKTEVNPITPH